jgi:hypothetical protein
MKTWWIIALSVTVASAAHAAGLGSRIELKDAEGKTVAQGVLCSSCKTPGEKCREGVVDGWLDGKPCGSCLMQTNWGVIIRHSRDLSIIGRLMLEDGKPAKKHYVKLFLPNGWGGRTQTGSEGHFRLRMGATADREKGDPLVLDLGERVDWLHHGKDQFTLYLLPDAFNPCPETDKKP